MLKKLSVKSQLVGMLVGIVLLLVSFAIVVWIAVGSISVAADSMGQGKDVVADILPPPLYVLEAELTVLQLQDAKGEDVTPLIVKLASLKKEYDDRNAFWEKEALDPAVKQALLGEQKKAADNFWKLVLGDYATAVKQGDSARARQLAGDVSKSYLAHRNGVDATVKVASTYADNTLATLQGTSARVRWLVLLMAGGGALLATVAMTLVVSEIMRRLGGEPLTMMDATQRIADGDLTVELAVARGDHTSLLSSIGEMQSNLRKTITQSREAADQVADAARGLAASSQQVSRSSSQQSEAAASMASAVEEVTVSISHVADSAASARGMAEETGNLSTEGKNLVQNTIGEINKIAESVTRSSDVIKTLGDQSNQISGIVNVIKEIADQTNLLALNAAIEAARAGEQGRGFAVVADEVRKLAERTTSSTKEIAIMIDAVQQGTQSAVGQMEEGRNQVGDGVQMAAKTGDSIARIQTATQQVIVAIEDISNALREQTAGGQQIAQNVEKIAQMTEENSAAVGAVSQSADRLEQLAVALKSSVDKFRV
ncbi:MAG: methyl-accepting chemotaxis protein [Proteobacteria bacterium]|nr:methyl-accepting chemotaxis protein [Pseudomonadota bacterium]